MKGSIDLIFLGALLGFCNCVSIDYFAKQGSDCVIELDKSGYPSSPPIILDSSEQLVYPEGTYSADDRTITVTDGDFLYLGCSGYAFASNSLGGSEFATATCTGGIFSVVTPENSSPTTMDFGELGCTRQPDDTSFETGNTCGPNNEGTEILLGFQMETTFANTITVCFDEVNDRTLYTNHILPRNTIGRDTGNGRPDFDPDGYFDYDVDDSYKADTQIVTIDILTGGLGITYIDQSSDRYMSKGHLTPNADPIYYSHQDSTFFFINVGPQWQCFNGGNWNGIENSIRTWVEDNQIDLSLYTGTHGVLQLDDINGNPVDITLHEDILPAPAYFWKVAHDPVANTAVALIGVNNPYTSDIAGSIVCSETIDNHPMLDQAGNVNDPYRGIVYACATDQVGFEEIPPELVGLPILM